MQTKHFIKHCFSVCDRSNQYSFITHIQKVKSLPWSQYSALGVWHQMRMALLCSLTADSWSMTLTTSCVEGLTWFWSGVQRLLTLSTPEVLCWCFPKGCEERSTRPFTSDNYYRHWTETMVMVVPLYTYTCLYTNSLLCWSLYDVKMSEKNLASEPIVEIILSNYYISTEPLQLLSLSLHCLRFTGNTVCLILTNSDFIELIRFSPVSASI